MECMASSSGWLCVILRDTRSALELPVRGLPLLLVDVINYSVFKFCLLDGVD